MDFMDIDQVVEVPDTPDRLAAHNSNKGGEASMNGHLASKGYVNERLRNHPKEKSKLPIVTGNRRLFARPDSCSSSPASLLGNSHSFKNGLPKVDTGRHEKGKAPCNSNVQRSTCQNGSTFVDLTDKSGRGHVFEKSKSVGTSGTRQGFGQKRLVRNGCISPHNIGKCKQVAEKHDTGSVAKEVQSNAGAAGTDGASSTVDIKNLIAEARDSIKRKGKGVACNPSSSEGPEARSGHFSQRSSVMHKEATSGTSVFGGHTSKHCEGLDGWRTTRNRSRNVDVSMIDGKPHASTGNQNHELEGLEFLASQCVSSPVSGREHKLGQFKESAQLSKRQRQCTASSDNRECSTSRVDDSEIVVIGSGEAPISRSSRNRNRVGRVGTSNPVIALDELSAEEVTNTRRGSNEDSSVQALQVEADEMLARELQEQLYNEELAPAVGTDEMDAHLASAMALQQDDGSQHGISAVGLHAPRPRGSSALNLYQRSRSHASRSPIIRRSVQAQAPTRMARLRGRFPGRPRTLSSTSTSRSSIFPPNMDVDMRMFILETLEAVSDMEVPNHLLHLGREFDENDYEMLLALDENNHQHGGATPAQINNLPQSTVQAENLQECSICLETPAVGETIRHLPCLHRFHKDCIDQWLRRKTSCPVCKSSIT